MAQLKKSTLLVGIMLVAVILALAKFFTKPTAIEQPAAETSTAPADTPGSAGNNAQPIEKNDVPAMDSASKKVSTVAHYSNPGGSDDVGFTIVVDNQGVITDVETQVLAKNPTSQMRQKSFAAAAPAVLVGKKLSELTAIDRVGSSSLTTEAFNLSLGKLKAGL